MSVDVIEFLVIVTAACVIVGVVGEAIRRIDKRDADDLEERRANARLRGEAQRQP